MNSCRHIVTTTRLSYIRGVARNLIWVGINDKTRQNNHIKKFKVDWFGGVYIPIYRRRYAPGLHRTSSGRLTYEHCWSLEQIAERIVEQIENGAGVKVGEANQLTGKERLPRSYNQTSRLHLCSYAWYVCNKHITYLPVLMLLFLLLLSSIVSMMLRLLLDASICFCPTPQPLLVVQSTSLLPCLVLHCPSISSVVFLGSFSHWYSSVMLLLAAVRFPFLTHARTNLVFALLFCQPASFPDTPRTVSFNRRKQILLWTFRGSGVTVVPIFSAHGQRSGGRPHNMSALGGRQHFLVVTYWILWTLMENCESFGRCQQLELVLCDR